MKIAIIGQQDFGKAVLEAFLARQDQVAGVFCAPEKAGGRPDALKVAAQEKGVRVFQFASLKSDDAKKALQDLGVELGVMAFVLQFAPQDFVNIPKHGTIQYHPSLLPKYRGPSSINWPIIRGDAKTGLTIFRPTEGLDEGPVVLQKECAQRPAYGARKAPEQCERGNRAPRGSSGCAPCARWHIRSRPRSS